KTGDKVYQVGMAQTCPVQIAGTNIIIPRIIDVDPSTQLTKPHKGKPRMYLNNGTVSCDSWDLVNADTGAVTSNVVYPQAHHLDNLTTASFDLNFGVPVEVFYAATTYTTDNLFYRFHAQFIREITGRDSKVLNAWFKLNENDFYENFMRRLCNVDGVLYRKNIIKDWIANTNNLVKSELIRIVAGRSRSNYAVAVPETFEPDMAPVVNFDGTTRAATADFSAKSSRLFYLIDPSAGDVIVTLDATSIKAGWTGEFFKTTLPGRVTLSASGGNINGGASVILTGINQAAKVRFDGENFYVI
ncbi:MAG TPA: hypothetical protein VIH30_02280, partial [Aquirhabdus sp.]